MAKNLPKGPELNRDSLEASLVHIVNDEARLFGRFVAKRVGDHPVNGFGFYREVKASAMELSDGKYLDRSAGALQHPLVGRDYNALLLYARELGYAVSEEFGKEVERAITGKETPITSTTTHTV